MSIIKIDTSLLKARVKGFAYFSHFVDGELVYLCDHDRFEVRIPVAETMNAQGASPTFKAREKAIVLMRWIRRCMVEQAEFEAMVAEAKAASTG